MPALRCSARSARAPFLGGSDFTIADIANDAHAHLGAGCGFPLPGFPTSRAGPTGSPASSGRAEEGRKDRPCAIVVARVDEAGYTSVLVVPITHAEPPAERRPVALPRAVKRRLGLDDRPSWIVTDELNQCTWPGFDLRPVSRQTPDVFHFGFLPSKLFKAVKRAILANAASLRSVQR